MSEMWMPTPQPAAQRSELHPEVRAETRLARWFAVAVLIHAGAVLIPLSDGIRNARAPNPLRISLTAVKPTPTESVAIPEAAEAPAILPEPDSPVTLPPEQTSPAAPRLPADEAPPELDTAPLSAARLFDLDGRREWRLDEPAGQRRLGVFTPRALPENWRSGIPYRSEAPGGRALPERVQIVDRWLAADGSHNVLVETPTGEQLCGRAEAWDPMRPLVEPVMMFRSCGAGPPTFVWPERYQRKQTP